MSKALLPDDGSTATASAADARLLSEDWITIWHSELAAIAVDRELQENWQLLVSFWLRSAHAAWMAGARHADAGDDADDRTVRSARTDAAARTAASAHASDVGLDAIERLSRRIDGLERIVAGLERGRRSGGRRRTRR